MSIRNDRETIRVATDVFRARLHRLCLGGDHKLRVAIGWPSAVTRTYFQGAGKERRYRHLLKVKPDWLKQVHEPGLSQWAQWAFVLDAITRESPGGGAECWEVECAIIAKHSPKLHKTHGHLVRYGGVFALAACGQVALDRAISVYREIFNVGV